MCISPRKKINDQATVMSIQKYTDEADDEAIEANVTSEAIYTRNRGVAMSGSQQGTAC